MKRTTKIRRGGFTLVEMMVVIAIIAILAAILVPTLSRVTRRARETRIATEMSQIGMQIETYQQQYKDYPPDFTSVKTLADLSDPANLLVRHLRRAFPQHRENLAGIFVDGSGNLSVPDPSEAWVFWLTRIKKDSRYPISGPGAPEKPFELDETRLIDPDSDGWFSYAPQDAETAPYVYFDSRTYGNITDATTWASYTDFNTAETLYPYQFQLPNVAGTKWAAETKFQLISAGLDGEYGETPTTPGKVFPIGTNYKPGDLDNITNFNDGKPLRNNPDYDL